MHVCAYLFRCWTLDPHLPISPSHDVPPIPFQRTNVGGIQIYVALFPCNECAKLIIQSGIREVVYLSDKVREGQHPDGIRGRT